MEYKLAMEEKVAFQARMDCESQMPSSEEEKKLADSRKKEALEYAKKMRKKQGLDY